MLEEAKRGSGESGHTGIISILAVGKKAWIFSWYSGLMNWLLPPPTNRVGFLN
jgi:hypothetical protein